jgi:hypothetical protein
MSRRRTGKVDVRGGAAGSLNELVAVRMGGRDIDPAAAVTVGDVMGEDTVAVQPERGEAERGDAEYDALGTSSDSARR